MDGETPEPDLRVIEGDDSVQVVGHLDRRLAEALALEVRAIAKRYGLEVQRADTPAHEVTPLEPGDGTSDSTQ